MAAVVRAANVSMPVLSSDIDAARAFAAAVNARAGGAQPWQRFALECGARGAARLLTPPKPGWLRSFGKRKRICAARVVPAAPSAAHRSAHVW